MGNQLSHFKAKPINSCGVVDGFSRPNQKVWAKKSPHEAGFQLVDYVDITNQ